MAIHVALTHRTEYRYDRRVSLSPHLFRLRPAVHTRTPIHAYALHIEPKPHFIHWQQDPFGNHVARVVFPEQTTRLSVVVDIVAELTAINPFDFFVEESAETCPFAYDDATRQELQPYLSAEPAGPLLQAFLAALPAREGNTVQVLVKLNRAVQEAVGYTVRLEPGVQSCEDTLQRRTGSCRDSAWLLVQVLRHCGLAARFVSGYLVQLRPDEVPLDGPAGPAADFTDLHAWTEVFIPGAGWIGLDPTSGLLAGEGHIPLACTPDPAGAAPVTGASDVCEVEFFHANEVRRVLEDPRVSRPYTEETWQRVLALGEQVDAALRRDDVRLTMGGEPTFVSLTDTEAPEWNSAADGPQKRQRGHALFERLCTHHAPGGVRLYGQGKWYPGEPLPRWQYTCVWRQDGAPLWCEPSWLADPGSHHGASLTTAQQFLEHMCDSLFLGRDFMQPVFEDAAHHLVLEQRLPVDIDPHAADLSDPVERRRLARLLSQGLHKPVAFVLPLQRDSAGTGWQSCRWQVREGRLVLIPGDSPAGLRLPLDRLAWAPRQAVAPQGLDPCAPREPLTTRVSVRPAAYADGGFMQTALVVEAREGRLHVFLPPVTDADAWAELLSVIEAVAAHMAVPVVLEGYDPPRDSRLVKFMVTPDPGVLEVNVQPCADWPTLVSNTTALYACAARTGLAAVKYMLDGRQTGTGGGHHVTLGGATTLDSPLLRRPDVLRSLITFWQHHPGLSYVFSGLFIGPTSQAPRVDEGRDETLYELDIALAQLGSGQEESPRPWAVDRILRHLLVDITGNTHRSEFCIDKLFSPDSPTGRLGLLEFRGFEMPPHERMALVQMLLLRTLVAAFWHRPYHHPLVRWGTSLHDKFMLPHFVHADLADVVDWIQRAGFDFQLSWFDPFVEFRFPVYGRVNIRDMALELRTAIEPWHVLGEEVGRSGTSRYVDSSLERLQVKLSGMVPGRYRLLCNGRAVPLTATGQAGEYVAGIRFRAWQPPSCLHPMIGVQTPLVFDLLDTWNRRSVGGCTYHVMHPGGRNHDTFPVNGLEAEGRRMARFWDHGHTPPVVPELQWQGTGQREDALYSHEGKDTPLEWPDPVPHPEYPSTLDLRWPAR